MRQGLREIILQFAGKKLEFRVGLNSWGIGIGISFFYSNMFSTFLPITLLEVQGRRNTSHMQM